MTVLGQAPILVVDDDRRTAALLSLYLGQEGYKTVCAYAGNEALELAAARQPRLAILDVMLPDLDGWEVCRRLRAASALPIMMLSGLGQAHDRIKGINLGADDYMVKPCSFQELVARVGAILRRSLNHSASSDQDEPQPGLRLDVSKRRATLDGAVLALTRSEFRLLQALIESPGRVFLREELLLYLYPDGGVVVDRVIDVHVGNLRRKVEQDPSHPRYILTSRGVGYCFCNDAQQERHRR